MPTLHTTNLKVYMMLLQKKRKKKKGNKMQRGEILAKNPEKNLHLKLQS